MAVVKVWQPNTNDLISLLSNYSAALNGEKSLAAIKVKYADSPLLVIAKVIRNNASEAQIEKQLLATYTKGAARIVNWCRWTGCTWCYWYWILNQIGMSRALKFKESQSRAPYRLIYQVHLFYILWVLHVDTQSLCLQNMLDVLVDIIKEQQSNKSDSLEVLPLITCLTLVLCLINHSMELNNS